MNRKDIIIIATIINVGLLIALFVGALKQGRERSTIAINTPNKVEKAVETSPAPSLPLQGNDQIDQILQHYVSQKNIAKEREEHTFSPPLLTPEQKEKKGGTSPVENQMHMVTVEKGDILEKIARLYEVEVDEIMKLNHLSDSRLQVGQILKLPKKQSVKRALPHDEQKYYTVQIGDNPWTIAQKHQMKVDELLHLNNMDESKAKKLRPGDRLKIK